MFSELSYLDVAIVSLSAFLLGLSKSGIKGISIVIVTLLVPVFGAKASTGVLLPMLIVGDVFAVIYYNRHAQWRFLFKLLPPMVIGVLVATWLGDQIPESLFRKAMAGIILLSVFMMFWWDRRKSTSVPDNLGFAGAMGFTAGFTTMIGNLAGSFANLYFLAMQLPKNAFIGTTAWLFLLINLFKVPFHIWGWETINWQTSAVSFSFTPAIFIGLFIGVRLLKKVNDRLFRRFILFATAVGALLIFLTD